LPPQIALPLRELGRAITVVRLNRERATVGERTFRARSTKLPHEFQSYEFAGHACYAAAVVASLGLIAYQ
jgi:hypothetical protein